MRIPIPHPSTPATRNVMKANKAKDTGPEIILRRHLKELGLGGYRLCYKNAPGKPDICYPGKRIAIFVHGCFWHRCPRCNLPMPKSNVGYWREKFKRNKERDARKRAELEHSGWKVFEFWECVIKENPFKSAREVMKYAREQGSHSQGIGNRP